MKKVKIMLTAITVMAVVGGALAFKAVKFNESIYCDTTAKPGVCDNLVQHFSVTPVGGQQSAGSSTCTTTNDGTGVCAERPTYAND